MKFLTNNNKTIPAVTSEQMKKIDRIATEETGPNLFQMMENAGRNLAELTIRSTIKDTKENIIILAGTGGNGGGGICAARHLANRDHKVKVCLTGTDTLSDITNYQLHILKSTDARVIFFNELKDEKPDVIIDAIFGYGLKGEPKGEASSLINWANEQLAIKISLDVPSGVNATTGKTSKHFIKPDITLTLALPKTGLLPKLTGELYLGDIGITKSTIEKVIPEYDSLIYKDDYLISCYSKD